MFEGVDDHGLIDVIVSESRASASADARKYAAIAELERRRDTGEHGHWACDDFDAAAAEVAAALNVGHGRARGQLDLAIALRDRLPRVAALFLAGELDARRIWLIEQRTHLVTDDEALAALDAAIAERITAWGPQSEYKLTKSLDGWVAAIDPGAVRRTRESSRGRDFVIGSDDGSGTVSVWGRVHVTDAAIAEERFRQMVHQVCDDDPRTLPQRRADAFGALCAGSTRLSCQCGRPDCPAVVDDGRASSVVVHVVADQQSTEARPDPELHGEPPGTDHAEPAAPRHMAALVYGRGIVPSPLLAELVDRGAKLRPVRAPKSEPEPRYRPSTALDEFVRVRDMTCRAAGCDRPAASADIDHTVAHPAGPTHPGNLKCYCRIHHLIKTFRDGWSDRQLADGTIVITTPTGHTYRTRPTSLLFFPGWAVNTPAPPTGPVPPSAHRTSMMPTRRRTRAQARADRIKAERSLNEADLAARDVPPPF